MSNSKNQKRFWTAVLLAVFGIAILGHGTASSKASEVDGDRAVGLSLFFQNSQMPAFTLFGSHPRYLSEVDIVASTPPVATDTGVQPLMIQSEFAALDWTGVKMVEENWAPPGDGTYTRQRFYRGAKWMENPSFFQVFAKNSRGRTLGSPLLAIAGTDDKWARSDDGFVRRFVVRQRATGCPSVGDCTGAQFSVEGLAQWRHNLHAEERTVSIPGDATQLVLMWNQDPSHPRVVPVSHASESGSAYGYGFSIGLKAINPPANGSYYVRGEKVTFEFSFLDGEGRNLFPNHQLPSYSQFLAGQVPQGLRYYDGFRLSPTLYYVLKHRESNLLLSLSGPTDQLRTPHTTVDISQFFSSPGGQVPAATVATDGFSSAVEGLPPLPITFGGLSDPALWNTPLSDQATFTIPNDALPGTYVAAIKARRDFGGEALNRGTTVDIQVGTATPSSYVSKTGNCEDCHNKASGFDNVLHGISDRRACFSCHPGLSFEPDNPLDIRVHTVHDRSNRFPADIHNCSTCHLTPPTGPARGLLP